MLLQLLLAFLLFSPVLSYEQVCNHHDRSSLLTFLTNITTSSFHPSLNWSSFVSCCHWEGIDCDASGRVTRLELPSRGLQGIINPSIGNLVRLTHLNLSNNYLNGTLREIIVGLPSIKVIDLSLNHIHGSIPREIGNLFHLEKLHLHENELHGPVPSSLMNCLKLNEIVLRFNNLNGDISKLDFSRLAHLQKLDLGMNRLEGIIPEGIYSCKLLVALRLSDNHITGQISRRIAGLNSLSFVSLTDNYFTNITLALRALAKCKNLTVLLLSSNFHGEPLPTHRKFLGLNGFSNLQYLGLSHSNFSGPVPNWLSDLKKLRFLSLNYNKMTGRVPNWLGTLPYLVSLHLGNNNFSGEFPLQLCQLPSLVSQDVYPNLTYFYFDLPVFNQNLSISWFKTTGLGAVLDLSYNRFSGNIPPQIGNLQNVLRLYLHYNNFSGQIPVGISKIKKLEEIDLSENSLTGEIPTSFEGMNSLSHFNVSFNNLEGPIPFGGQFDTFEESEFIGNPRLCGEQIHRPCNNKSKQNTNVIDGYTRRDRMHVFVNGLIVGFACGFSSVLAIVASYVWFKIFKGW